jgi:NAD+ kinase
MRKKRFGIIGNSSKVDARETIRELLPLLAKEGIESVFLPEGFESGSHPELEKKATFLEIVKDSDIIFSVGGDGTMLTAARAIMHANPAAELIGLNVGKLGFLAENPPKELAEIVGELFADSLKHEGRSFITAMIKSESNNKNGVTIRRNILEPYKEGRNVATGEMIALNEFVIDNFGSTRMLTFSISIDGSELGRLRADGLIVATPTGSTGYALSAGGPIVEPTSPVHVIIPIAPHSLTIRPIILSNTSEIQLKVTSEAETPALVVADGQEEVVVETPAIISLSAYPQKLNLLRRRSQSYFDLLRTKLLWSADVREPGKGRW